MDGDGGLTRAMGDGVDVSARPAARVPGRHRDPRRLRSDGEALFVELSLGADEADAGAVVVVKPGSLAGHPGEHPDVDAVVVVQQLVAPPSVIDNDERAPQVRPTGNALHELFQRPEGEDAGLDEELGGSVGELLGEVCDGDVLALVAHGMPSIRWCRAARGSYEVRDHRVATPIERVDRCPLLISSRAPEPNSIGVAMSDKIVIAGGGLAAARTVRAYRNAGGTSPITMLSADTQVPYNRPPLSKGFLRGEVEADAVLVEPRAAYGELGVDIRLEVAVTGVDTRQRRVQLDDGTTVDYGRLVLATGACPRRLGIPGEKLRGVHAYRTLDDAQAVRDAAQMTSRALVVGAGFIGMETAASLRARGLEVTLVEPGDGLFASLRAPAVSHSLARLYDERGVEVILGDTVASFDGSGGRLERAVLRSGRTVDAELAVVGVGVEPSTGYLDGSSISLESGAVLVDERFESSVQGVYAVGDLAYFHDPVFGHRRLVQHWTNANYQGERLGRILAGEDAPYDLVAMFFSEVFGTKIGLLGDLDAGCDELVLRGSLEEGHLIGFYGREHVLVAALVSGQTPEVQGELTHLLRSHATLHDAVALREHGAPLAAGFHRTADLPSGA